MLLGSHFHAASLQFDVFASRLFDALVTLTSEQIHDSRDWEEDHLPSEQASRQQPGGKYLQDKPPRSQGQCTLRGERRCGSSVEFSLNKWWAACP